MGEVAWIAKRTEQYCEKWMEDNYMKKESQSIYTALEGEDLDFYWEEADVLKFDQMWRSRVNLLDIARYFGRDPDEVVVLAIDRARKGFIGKRKGGIVGIGSRQK